MSLKGIKAICEYENRSEVTILEWIRERGYPAKRDPKSATWTARISSVKKWHKQQLGVSRGIETAPGRTGKNQTAKNTLI